VFLRKRRAPERRPEWRVVATTSGILGAEIIAGRLKNLGIPTVIHRESVGSAIGLTVGRLGEAKVLVPEEFFKQAMAALESDETPLSLDDPSQNDI